MYIHSWGKPCVFISVPGIKKKHETNCRERPFPSLFAEESQQGKESSGILLEYHNIAAGPWYPFTFHRKVPSVLSSSPAVHESLIGNAI